MKLRLTSTSHTARGKRERNEDSYFASDERGLYVVADGVGGLPMGSVASSVAVQEAVLVPRGETTMVGYSRRIMRAASEAIRQQDQQMGTTLTYAIFDRAEATMHVGHAGDSRLYLLRNGKLSQITMDQAYNGALVGGLFTKSSHRADPPRYYKHPVRPGDIMLLCTDGIHGCAWHGGVVPESVIYRAMKHEDAEWLVTTAISEWHGSDNATAVIVRVM